MLAAALLLTRCILCVIRTGEAAGIFKFTPSPALPMSPQTPPQVTFTSLRLVPGGGGSLVAGGWSTVKGSDKAESFVVAEINPSERLVTFKAAQVRCI